MDFEIKTRATSGKNGKMGFEIYLMTIFGCQTFHTSDQLFFDGKESKQGGFRNSSVLFKTERESLTQMSMAMLMRESGCQR